MSINNKLQSKLKGDKFITIEAFLSLFIVYATIFNKPNIVSVVFRTSFIILLYHFIMFLIKYSKFDKRVNLLIAVVGVSLINVLISTILSGVAIELEYFNSYFIFLSAPIFFCLAIDYKISGKTERFFFIMQIIIAMAYPICYMFIEMQTNHTNAIAFNFSNPNLAGMFIFVTVLYMLLGIIRYKRKSIKAIFIVLSVLDIIMMLKTGARNALLALFIFLCLICIIYIKKRYTFPNWILAFFSYLPSLFVPIYLLFINVVINNGWLSFLISEGKNLDSRVTVWKSFLERLKGRWLIGNYDAAVGNAHNSHMVLFCSFGIVVLFLVIVLIYRILKDANKSSTTFYDACCISAFLATLSMGIGEGAIYSGGQGIYILCGSFLFLMNRAKPNDKNTVNLINNSKIN